jgi:DNA-3-methyladenine glycosylase I
MKTRCSWVPVDNRLYQEYHDQEWGVPQFNDDTLFEMLILEGMQAGLSWSTILKKRVHLRLAFGHFRAAKIARYDEHKISKLLKNPAIIRNRRKIIAVVQNARAFLKVKKEYHQFNQYIWQFVNGKPIINSWENINDIPADTAISNAMSNDLKKRGFSFVGSTICYAFMQAVGMVNDHTVDCYRYEEINNKLNIKK